MSKWHSGEYTDSCRSRWLLFYANRAARSTSAMLYYAADKPDTAMCTLGHTNGEIVHSHFNWCDMRAAVMEAGSGDVHWI